jgi:hypothetical protein
LDTDTDSDGTADCLDNCDHDPLKTEPGICSCGTPDTDSDIDGTPDCNDDCPNDPGKTSQGVCGCGTADTDTEGDQVPDCMDAFPDTRIFKGDLNNDSRIDLIDAVLAVQLVVGIEPTSVAFKGADVNNDGKIELAEILYILKNISAE